MRQLTVSEIKGRRKKPTQRLPKEGTALRALYDMFMMHKGIPIGWNSGGPTGNKGADLEALKNYYGLDIRNVKRRTWLLAGEWVGNVYIDYVAETLDDKAKTPNSDTILQMSHMR